MNVGIERTADGDILEMPSPSSFPRISDHKVKNGPEELGFAWLGMFCDARGFPQTWFPLE
jgi:hypothetical protein